MAGVFQHIELSLKGKKPRKFKNQDFYLFKNCGDYIVAVVADGLGSCELSHIGSKTICDIIAGSLMNASVRDSIFSGYPISDFSKLWFDKLASLSDVSLYKTTASFVLVDKRRKIASMAWVGDSPIAYRVDGRSVISLAEEKEFANVTECLSTGHEQFKICMIAYRDTFDFLVASDGLFDELDEEKFDSLFDYFIQKFSDVPYNKRRSILKKDIRNSVYDFNSDDKTMIFSWTINRK